MQVRGVTPSWKCCTAEQSLTSFQNHARGCHSGRFLAGTRHTTLRARICGKDKERCETRECRTLARGIMSEEHFHWTFFEKAATES